MTHFLRGRMLPALALLALLSACGADRKFADDATIETARYVSDEAPSLTLYTVVNNRTGAGAHSALLIDGRERVMYDPAGTWYHPTVPERYDLHYGITPRMLSFYIDYHARETFRVIEQKIPITLETADRLVAQATAAGAAGKATCANTVSGILRGVPGFEAIGPTWFPNRLAADFATLPGVTERVITDKDDDNNHGVLTVQANGEPTDI